METLAFKNRFTNKVAIVTGGGTGIGRATAATLAREGAKVLVVGRRQAPLKDLVSEYSGEIECLVADVSEQGSSQRIVDYVLEIFGRLDILVNNAANVVFKPLAETTDDEIERQLTVNIKALLCLSRDAIPALQSSSGNIINISSVAGQTSLPGFSAYASTKAAGDRITKTLAAELGPLGIRVNAVAPGLTQTDMLSSMPQEAIDKMASEATALRRLGTPDDIARSIIWLASADAEWVTGQVIQASGGLLLN